jgi:flagella basal body P-ring formation protein FlgA
LSIANWQSEIGNSSDMEVAMMNNHNGRPLSRKLTVRLMIALTILAWATQTLLKQWGYGAPLNVAQAAPATEEPEPTEKFVPQNTRFIGGASVELRSDATVVGSEVKLRQICRWSDHDKPMLDPIGELVIARIAQGTPFKSITIQELRDTLRDAGVNIGAINFCGATHCTVNRSDVEYDEQTALQQWANARQASDALQSADAVLEIAAKTAPTTVASADAGSPVQTLRSQLIADLASRLNLAPDSLQIDFKQQDAKLLELSQPLFKFQIDPLRARSLGNVMWNVTIFSNDKVAKKVVISAEARAWQEQLVAARPLAFHQTIREADIAQRRALVDQLSDDPLLTKDQIIGQQASREMKPDMVFTSRTIDPTQLVKVGQYVTITLNQGTVRIKTVARAMESGSYGQTIRVKNETTKDVFQVVLTGPQTATMNLGTSVATVGTPN